jgi:hypothetical protein
VHADEHDLEAAYEEAERQQLLAWLPRIFPKGSDRR